MLTEDLIKEELSIAYMHIVTTICGYQFEVRRVDVDSVDAIITTRMDEDAHTITPTLAIQLKATNQERVHRSFNAGKPDFSYELKKKNYNDLCKPWSSGLRLLVVLLLPEEEGEWVAHDPAELSLRHCAYWHCLAGEKPVKGRSKVVRINKGNVCSPEQIRALIENIAYTEDFTP